MELTIQNKTVDFVFSYYEKYGHHNYGENVTQLSHAVQAAELAVKEGYPKEIILAAFLHDIGHLIESDEDELMGRFGVKDHESLGAAFLKDLGFSDRLVSLVNSHVAAKRYLTYAKPEYHDQLSEASKMTLKYQGGPMSPEEAKEFEQGPWFALKIKMREWDDLAKETNYSVTSIEQYKVMMQHHLESNT